MASLISISLVVYILSTLTLPRIITRTSAANYSNNNVFKPTSVLTLPDGSRLFGSEVKDGTAENKDVMEFLGIPYAQAPMGQLRFKPPRPSRPWSGVLNATTFSPICQQKVQGSFLATWISLNKINLSEDCLYLNIWVPKTAASSNNFLLLPVMVWIHGGGFYAGTSAEPVSNGRVLAGHENVIVVSMNYRLNVFGFIYAGIPDAPGNVGLLDQLEALKWIQRNIVAFGGDPASVTLFGCSAGGASVSFHALSPLSSPYFKRIVLQSGAALNPWAITDAKIIQSRVVRIAKLLRCGGDRNETATTTSTGNNGIELTDQDWARIVDCLRSKSAEQLIRTFNMLTDDFLLITWTPVIDNYFLTGHPIDLIRAGQFKRTEVLLGNTVNEGSFFLYVYFSDVFNFQHKEKVDISDGTLKSLINRTLLSNYRPNNALVGSSFFEYETFMFNDPTLRAIALEQMASDVYFTCGSELWAQYSSNFGTPTYRYVFAYDSPGVKVPWLKCPHGYEQEFVFGRPLVLNNNNNFTAALTRSRLNKNEKILSKATMRFWANFARTGNPNLNSDGSQTEISWPEYTNSQQAYFIFSGKINAHSYAFRKRKCHFWNEYAADLFNLTKKCFSER